MKRWVARGAAPGAPLPLVGDAAAEAGFAACADKLGIPAPVVALLARRGLTALPELNVFLSPLLRHLERPESWPGMDAAATALTFAIGEGREVLVWGDYDVDGVTAAALCFEVLRYHNVPVRVHLPDRQTEGYGLNIASLEALAADGTPRVLLTVDCGINDVEPVARARALGMRVVVSDHHLPSAVLPAAEAVCNPRLGASPCPHLAGVGVAFFLMALVNARLAEASGRTPKDMREVLDLVGLGTLADMVSLTGQNRILAKNGLLKIAEAARPGLADLKFVSGYDRAAALGAGQVVFSLAPRLNAAGRVGSAEDAFTLLALAHGEESARLARRLDELNAERRAEEERISQSARTQAEAMLDTRPELTGLVVYGADWHPGVIGIVASRLVELFHRPTLVLCRLGEFGLLKGSGRSVPGFDLHAGLGRCADLLAGFGGHKQAAGLSMDPAHLAALRERFHQTVRDCLGSGPFMPELALDGVLPFALASDVVFLKALELLQPFGMGNPEPVFATRPLNVRSVRLFGPNREHALLRVQEPESGITMQAKLWRQAGELNLADGQGIRLAFVPGINAYNGIASVELVVKDWELL